MVSFFCTSCGNTLDPTQSPGKPKVRCGDCGALVDLRNLPGFESSSLEKKSKESSANPAQAVDNPFENGIASEKKKKAKATSKRKEKPTPTIHGETAPTPFAPSIPEMETSQEDDGKAYAMPGGIDFLCPQCTRTLISGTIVCTRCGFDMRTGKKLRKSFKSVHLQYGPQISPYFRVGAWILMAGPLSLPYFLGTMTLDPRPVLASLFVWFLVAFILGTWWELFVERKANGKTYYTKKMRIAFLRFPSKTVSSENYIGIKVEERGEVGLLEYFVLGALFLMLIFPAIIFYYTVLQRPEFAVCLTGEHGKTHEYIFSSRNPTKIIKIFEEVRKISGLRNDN